jgi:hypothetical protein
VKLHVTTYQDRRTLEQLRHSDSIEEKRWRARIWLKQARRPVESRRQVSVGSRVGGLDPHRQGGAQPQPDVRPFPQRDPESGGHPENPTWRLVSVRHVRNGWTTIRRLLEGQEAAR